MNQKVAKEKSWPSTPPEKTGETAVLWLVRGAAMSESQTGEQTLCRMNLALWEEHCSGLQLSETDLLFFFAWSS